MFIDCASILQRSLHAASTAILVKRRRQYTSGSEADRKFIDVAAIKQEVYNHAAKPLFKLNREMRAVKKNGGIKATFVLGSSLSVRDLYIARKKGDNSRGVNILDGYNPYLLQSLKVFFEGKPSPRLYASPSEKDVLTIAQRLTDAFATIEIRQPDITQRCVEFCSDGDYVLSDDTNAIAFGAPNVIRDYCGRNVCNTINQNRMLEMMGFTREQFIDFCVLCGSNDVPLIPHIGPERAYHIVSTFGNIESFLESSAFDTFIKSSHVTRILEKVCLLLSQVYESI